MVNSNRLFSAQSAPIRMSPSPANRERSGHYVVDQYLGFFDGCFL